MSVNVRGDARTWREAVRKKSLKAVVRKCMAVVVGGLRFGSFAAIAVVGRYLWVASRVANTEIDDRKRTYIESDQCERMQASR
jgi:hypothetical protein